MIGVAGQSGRDHADADVARGPLDGCALGEHDQAGLGRGVHDFLGFADHAES
jgi:hypothetical protein